MISRKISVLLLAVLLPAAQAQTLMDTLPNGMKVLIKEDKRAPVAAVRLWYRVGSVDEHSGKTGLSHALEHMMFKGTPTVPAGQFSRRVAALGGDDNAYTSRTDTVYTTNIAVRNLNEVLKMEADRMVNLNFSDEDFLNEMKVIREERRMRTEDSPGGLMWETLNIRQWQKPANRAPVIGYMKDLHRLKAADLRAWYKQWYAPNNAMLVIVGDVDAKQTLTDVRQLFGIIAPQTLPERAQEAEPPQSAKGSKTVVKAVTAQPIVMLSWRVPKQQSVNDRQAHALDMLSLVLAGTDSARYEKKLVRGEALALGISGHYDSFGRQNATFNISAMPAGGIGPEKLTKRLLAEIREIADKGISEDELALIRTPLETGRLFAKDSIRNQADTLGELEQNGFGYQSEDEEFKQLLSVTPQEVRQAAQDLLKRPYTQVTVMPK